MILIYQKINNSIEELLTSAQDRFNKLLISKKSNQCDLLFMEGYIHALKDVRELGLKEVEGDREHEEIEK